MKKTQLKQLIKECIFELSYKSKSNIASYNIDVNKLEDITVDGVDRRDYPDMVDAYVTSAIYNGRQLSEEEIEWLNETHPEVASEVARDIVSGAR